MNLEQFKKKNELVRKIKGGTPVLANKKNLFGLDLGTIVVLGDDEFVITEKFLYEEVKGKTNKPTGYTWEEYSITSVDDPSLIWFLEVELDDKLYISLTKEKFNASKIDVVSNKKVSYNNEVFYLDEKCSARCTKFSTNDSWLVDMKDFESDDDVLLSIETWEDGNEEAYFYEEVSENSIKILK